MYLEPLAIVFERKTVAEHRDDGNPKVALTKVINRQYAITIRLRKFPKTLFPLDGRTFTDKCQISKNTLFGF